MVKLTKNTAIEETGLLFLNTLIPETERDNEALFDIAAHAKLVSVARPALRLITDLATVERISGELGAFSEIKAAARAIVSGQTAEYEKLLKVCKPIDMCNLGILLDQHLLAQLFCKNGVDYLRPGKDVNRLKDQKQLEWLVADQSCNSDTSYWAYGRVQNESVLAQAAMRSGWWSIDRIQDQKLVADLALHGKPALRSQAIRRLQDPAVLAEIAHSDPDRELRNLASTRLKSPKGTPVAPAAKSTPAKAPLDAIWVHPNRQQLEHPESLKEAPPDVYRVRFETTKGSFVAEIKSAWAPLGAKRFYNLVKQGYYSDCPLQHSEQGVSFGVSGDQVLNAAWNKAGIEEDQPPPVPRKIKEWSREIGRSPAGKYYDRVTKEVGSHPYWEFPKMRGYVFFDRPGGTLRTRLINITPAKSDGVFAESPDANWPIGYVTEGIDILESLNAGGCGEGWERNFSEAGNAYFKGNCPAIDYIKSAVLVSGR